VVVALDVRGGVAVGHGWRPGAPGVTAEEALRRLVDAGIVTFEVTAIDRDGRLEGPDLGLLSRLVRLGLGEIVASGGIASVDHLRAVRDLGCSGAIVGRALYEGRLDLREAVAALA
jgi:phosphoribosylformimino-5-aminoimidazole carboxamide ribonucleotide (ProFAR) isomerase